MPNRREALTIGLAGVASVLARPALVVPVAAGPRVPAATSVPPHDPRGEYLDYRTRGDIGRGSNVKFDSAGVITLLLGSSYVYNPVTISQYGLQQFTYWSATGDKAALHRAVVQGGWLVRNQNTTTGAWNYNYPFGVGAMSETLRAGWVSAMAQGQAMSLLCRIYSVYSSTSTYRTPALRGRWPFRHRVADGGVITDFHGHPHYEEWPTRSAATLALNGFQFSLIGLWDMTQVMPTQELSDLFDRGYETMVYQLPFHDMVTTTAYHLGHLTKPPRQVHHADHYHRVHVMLLSVLHELRPNPVVAYYRDRWATYPPMTA
jgi:hypothetical protein